MILLIFILLGLGVGLVRGGGLSGLVNIGLRGVWLVFLAAAAELTIYVLPGYLPWLFPEFLIPIQIIRFLPLAIFVIINIHKYGMWLSALGLALNIAVIASNGWRMPVAWQAPLIPGLEATVQKIADGRIPEYFIMPGPREATLWFFSDVIPCHIGFSGYASVGDVALGIGLLLLIEHSMARYSLGRHMRGSLAPRLGRHGATISESDHSPMTADIIMETPKPEHESGAANPSKPGAGARLAATTKAADADSSHADRYENETGSGPEILPLSGPLAVEEPERMIPIKLSPRLQTIAAMIDCRAAVADVGCDHGKLSAYLALSGCPKVVAVDVSAKSLSKTRELVRELGLGGVVQTRVSDGLKKLKPGEAKVIVMAGLGGQTISEVLASGARQAMAADMLVLQPMNSVGTVRRWLVDNGFQITDEQLSEEDGRIYQVLAATPGQDSRPPMSLFDLEVGHLLMSRRHPLLGNLLQHKLDIIDTILNEISDKSTPKAEARRNELIELRGRCVEALEWFAQ